MQVIGLCRFSFPALGGFQVEHNSADERAAFLYQPERMEERFAHFETISLPSIAEQTDDNFTFVIVTGDVMPSIYKERLRKLTAFLPHVVVQEHAPGGHREVMQAAVNAVREKTGEPCLQFRHDDDDAIALDFVARFREAAHDCRALLDRHKFVGFDFNRGFVAEPRADGIYAEETVHPYWGVAMGMSIRPHIRKSIMNFAHGRINRFMPTLTFTDSPMFVRGHNSYNDSRQGANVTKPKLKKLSPDEEQLFRDRFAVDADVIRSVFGGHAP